MASGRVPNTGRTRNGAPFAAGIAASSAEPLRSTTPAPRTYTRFIRFDRRTSYGASRYARVMRLLRFCGLVLLVGVLAALAAASAQAAATLTVTRITWNVVGLDSN